MIAILVGFGLTWDLKLNGYRLKAYLSANQSQLAYELASKLIATEGKECPELFLIRAKALKSLGRFEESIRDVNIFRSSGVMREKDEKESNDVLSWNFLGLGDFYTAMLYARIGSDKNLPEIIEGAKKLLSSAERLEEKGDLRLSLSKYRALLELCRGSGQIWAKAARVAFSLREMVVFLNFSETALLLSPGLSDVILLKAKYQFGRKQISVAEKLLKSCNSSNCTELLRLVHSFEQWEKAARDAIAAGNWNQAQIFIVACEQSVAATEDHSGVLSLTAKELKALYLIGGGKKQEALPLLNDVIVAFPRNVKLLIERGEILMQLNDLEGANDDAQAAKRLEPRNRRATLLASKVSELLEREKSEDYYSVLGIPSSATELEIKKGYKEASKKWHPDQFKDPLKKKEAERRMKLVNVAYDILSKPHERQAYDQEELIRWTFQEKVQKHVRKHVQKHIQKVEVIISDLTKKLTGYGESVLGYIGHIVIGEHHLQYAGGGIGGGGGFCRKRTRNAK
jgi:tetratricopeptide (TPR) repeat protein